MGRLPRPWASFNIANNAPFQLSSCALSLLLVFRWVVVLWSRCGWRCGWRCGPR